MSTCHLLRSHIDRVTAHPSGAHVVRVASLPAGMWTTPGRHRLRLLDLPLLMRSGTLRARVAGPGVRLLRFDELAELEVGGADPADDAGYSLEDLEAAVRQVRRQLRRIEVRLAVQTQLIAELSTSQLDAGPSPLELLPDATILGELADARHTVIARLDEAVVEARSARRATERALTLAQNQAQNARSGGHIRALRGLEMEVEVEVDQAEASGNIQLDYFVDGVRWSPSYVLELEGDTVMVRMQAQVAQATGELWRDAALSVSTARVRRTTALPELEAWRIGRSQPAVSSGWRPLPSDLPGLYAGVDGAGAAPSHDRTLGGSDAAYVLLRDVDEAVDRAEQALGAFSHRSSPPSTSPHSTSTHSKASTRDLLARIRGHAEGGSPPPDEVAAAVPPAPAARPAPPPAMPVNPSDTGFFALPPPMPLSTGAPAPPPPGGGDFRQMVGAAPPPAAPRAKRGRSRRKRQASGRTRSIAPPARPPAPTGPREPDALLDYSWLRLPDWTEKTRRGGLRPVTLDSALKAFVEERGLGAGAVSSIADALRNLRNRQRQLKTTALPAGCIDSSHAGFHHTTPPGPRVSLPSDSCFRSVQVTSGNTQARRVYRVVPRQDTSVQSIIELRNPTGIPLAKGPLRVLEGGGMRARGVLGSTGRDGPICLSLGPEERIRVARNARVREESRGMLGGDRALIHEVEVTVANRLTRPVVVEVFEALPDATEDGGVEVQFNGAQPQAHAGLGPHDRKDERALRWQLEVAAGTEQTIHWGYTITISARAELEGGNRREP